MTSFTERLLSFIKEKKLIQKGDIICVGISGGADSVCLLQLLYELSDNLGISLRAFHVNHCLRGAESDADQSFVEEFCADRGIPLKVYSFDVSKIAAQSKKSLEEAGRLVRRQAAAMCMEGFKANKTAVAHHLNDCAETLLFNLTRGTSLSGLKGISPKNGNIIRPFMIFAREEIENELKARNISWRTDSTNLEDEYSRNKLRLNVIPYLEKNINAESVRHIASAAFDIEEADEIIRELAEEKAKAIVSGNDSGILISGDIKKERGLIGGYIVMDALKCLTDNVTDIKRLHIKNVLRLMDMQTGRAIDLPYGILALRTYDGVMLSKKAENDAGDIREGSVKLVINGSTEFGGYIFETRLFDADGARGGIPKKKYTKWFDYDKLSNNLDLRYRKSGDHIVVDSEGHRKKLKRYFTDEKIPKEKRDSMVCLAHGSCIVWVIGGRISEDCKVDETTVHILEVSCREKPDL